MSDARRTRMPPQLDAVDARLAGWMQRRGITLPRMALGMIFLWFGVLKFFPGLSPAQTLAADTIAILTGGLLSPELAVRLLAIWETLIGLGLLFGAYLRLTLFLLWTQMLGTITPLFLFPDQAFTRIPYAPTLEGQYIVKNLVLVAAGIVIGATVRGAKLQESPPSETGSA